jgi:phenylacetate-CoA ligase
MVIVAGEPGGSVGSIRQHIEHAFGARVIDHAGMTEIGSVMMECLENPSGMHVLETECIGEVIDAATGQAVPAGKEGELVLTNLGRWGSPLIRYRTGDQVIADPKPCPCGRVYLRLAGGILGRADDMMVIRGNNVYPSTIEEIVRRFPGITEFTLEIDNRGPLTALRINLELADPPPELDVADTLRTTIRDELHFRPEVVVVPADSLPRSEMKSRRVVRKMEG